MKLERTDGCLCFSLTIDGIDEIEATKEKRSEFIDRLFERFSTSESFFRFIADQVITQKGENGMDDPDDMTWTLNLGNGKEFVYKYADSGDCSDSIYFNGELLSSPLDQTKIKELLGILKETLDINRDTNQILSEFLGEFGEQEEPVGPCECCGDYIYTYKYEL